MNKVTDVEPVVLNYIEPGSPAHKGTAVAINMRQHGHIIVVAEDASKASEIFSKLTDGEYPDVERMKEVVVLSAKEAF